MQARSTYLVPNTTDCQEWKNYNHQLECWVVHVGLLYSLLFALNQGIAEKQQVQQQQLITTMISKQSYFQQY